MKTHTGPEPVFAKQRSFLTSSYLLQPFQFRFSFLAPMALPTTSTLVPNGQSPPSWGRSQTRQLLPALRWGPSAGWPNYPPLQLKSQAPAASELFISCCRRILPRNQRWRGSCYQPPRHRTERANTTFLMPQSNAAAATSTQVRYDTPPYLPSTSPV